MKKHIVEIVILGLALILLITSVGIVTRRERKEEKEAIEAQIEEKSKEAVNTALEDETGDLNYNYITGTEKISKKYEEIPYNFYMDLSEEVNNYLQSQGIKGKRVNLVQIQDRGYTYILKFDIEDCEQQLVSEFKLHDWVFTNTLE